MIRAIDHIELIVRDFELVDAKRKHPSQAEER